MYLPNVLFPTNSPIMYAPFPFRMKAYSCSAALLKGFPKQVVLLPSSFSRLHIYSGHLQTLASSYNLFQPFPRDGYCLSVSATNKTLGWELWTHRYPYAELCKSYLAQISLFPVFALSIPSIHLKASFGCASLPLPGKLKLFCQRLFMGLILLCLSLSIPFVPSQSTLPVLFHVLLICVLLLSFSARMFMNVMKCFQTNFRNKAQLSSF